jgi:uncharacterized protein (DUF4415 family)
MPKEKTLSELAKMTDKDIDFTDIPELDDEFWKKAKVVMPPEKKKISLNVDVEVLSFFKAQGPRYQTRMNAVLRSFVEAHRE